MRKKHGLRYLVTLLLCCTLTGGIAWAASEYRTVQIKFNNIKLVVDGKEVAPKDVNGEIVEPFIYNGSTYLPVRAIGNAIGKEVGWDGTTSTVYIGDIPDTSSTNYLTPYQQNVWNVYNNEAGQSFTMMGKEYTQGLTFERSSNALYNMDGKYTRIEFDVGHVDGKDKRNTTIYIYADGQVVKEIEATEYMSTKHFSVRVYNAIQLKIEQDGYGTYGIANLVGI